MLRFMKTKKGFTLTELLLVVALVGIIVCIAVPIYNGFTKTARIRNCSAERIQAKAQAESWCKDNFFNDNFTYKIASDGEKSWVVTEGLNQDQVNMLKSDVHDGDLPICPSCGTITITVEPRASGTPKIIVTCDGGKDGDTHKREQ
jgi:prepilin-type N-terminal cleavage/methylation domain-containing protein